MGPQGENGIMSSKIYIEEKSCQLGKPCCFRPKRSPQERMFWTKTLIQEGPPECTERGRLAAVGTEPTAQGCCAGFGSGRRYPNGPHGTQGTSARSAGCPASATCGAPIPARKIIKLEQQLIIEVYTDYKAYGSWEVPKEMSIIIKPFGTTSAKITTITIYMDPRVPYLKNQYGPTVCLNINSGALGNMWPHLKHHF